MRASVLSFRTRVDLQLSPVLIKLILLAFNGFMFRSTTLNSIQFVLFHKMQIWNFVFVYLYFYDLQINFFLFTLSSEISKSIRNVFLSSARALNVCLFKLDAWVNNNIKNTPDLNFAVSFFPVPKKNFNFKNRFVYINLCV